MVILNPKNNVMLMRKYVQTAIATCLMGLNVVSAAALGDPAVRPVHWWIGRAHSRAGSAAASLVNSWTVFYDGDFRPELEQKRFHRQVGNTNEMDSAVTGLAENYDRGARLLATNLEPWDWETYPRFTAAQAREYVGAIDSRDDLTVVQWNNFMTWEADAIPVIEDHPRLKLIEMVYPTAGPTEPLTAFGEICDYIVWHMKSYSPGRKPAIGLSVYDSHAMDAPVSWELMKLQIDAAKHVGLNEFGSAKHPIGIFIADVLPTEFTVEDVNAYITGPVEEYTPSCTGRPGRERIRPEGRDGGVKP